MGKNDPEKFLLIQHTPFPGSFFSFTLQECLNSLSFPVFLASALSGMYCMSVVQSFVHIMKSKLMHVLKKKEVKKLTLVPHQSQRSLSQHSLGERQECNLSRMKRGKSNLFPWMNVSWELIIDVIYEFINFSLAGRTTSVKRC